MVYLSSKAVVSKVSQSKNSWLQMF
uniref:Uncharacterized protein n=1 Tax=Rhizophora mucronata TaxID=61149 RepID=A0A2P2NU59_RHIMU